jgi:glyoxylase-like metal-dependent hydrolase (beta-lactamase superfamily II)
MNRLFLFIALFFLGVSAAFPQTVTQQSYKQAREVLDKAVNAYGGVEGLRSIRNFTIIAEGDLVHRNQSRRPGMSQRTAYNTELVIDVKAGRFYQLGKGSYPIGFNWHQGAMSDGKDGAFFDQMRKTYSAAPNINPAAFRSRLRALPQMVVANALERASRLRYLGTAQFDKRGHQVISFSNEDGLEMALYFDDKTGLLSKFETLGTDPFTGDTVTETIFTGYRNEGARPVPTGRVIKVGGDATEEIRYTKVSFDAELADDKFKPSAEFKQNAQAAAAAAASPVTRVSDTVYTVNARGYNVLFADLTDYILVVESPGGDAASRFAIDQIKKTIPGKPIRYIVPTHHHDDHAGGLRTYIAEGATVVAIPGEKGFFEQVAKSVFTIDPDALSMNPKPIRIETVEGGRRVFTDGKTTVEIIDIGPNPHTEAMHIAYLPNEKIIFQGDMMNAQANGDYPLANDAAVYFYGWLERSKLPVERIIGVHGGPSTPAVLAKAVAAAAPARP